MESLNREKSYSRSRSKSNSQSKTKKLVIDNEDTSKSIISKFLKKYLGKKQEQMKQIDIDKIIRRNAANTIQTYTKKMLTKKRTNAATLIQNSVRMKTAKQNIDMRKNSRDIGVKIGNILCNNTLPKAISEIEKIIDVRKNFSRSKASVSMVKSIKDLRLLNCTLGRFNFPILTETIEDSTIFNVSFASTHFSGIKFSNVVFLSGTYNSEAYKVYTKYYGLEDKDKYSSKIGKKSDFKLNFTKSILKDCIFENCTFYNIIFNECKLSGCIFRNCKFISCSFKNTIFDELELDPVSKTPFLKGIYFKNCSIIFKKDTQYFEFISHNTNIDFSKSTMEEQKLYSFNDCLFTNNWTGLIGFLGDSSPMKQNIIKFIYFKNCSITLYNFSNLKIFNTDSDLSNFNKCIIKDCKFANCEINYNTFLDCDIQNTNFQQSVLYQEYNSKYKNNKFIKCNFLLINLVGCLVELMNWFLKI